MSSDEFGLCAFCDNPVPIDEALVLQDYEDGVIDNFDKLSSARHALIAISNLKDSDEARAIAEMALEAIGYDNS